MDLLQTLLYLSERGLYSQVQDLLKFPIQNCPDVLVLALLQISPPITMARQELLTNLIPLFLTNHPNSAIILHHAWHSQVCHHVSFSTYIVYDNLFIELFSFLVHNVILKLYLNIYHQTSGSKRQRHLPASISEYMWAVQKVADDF